MAAGVTVAKGALAPFRAFLENTLKDGVEIARREDSLLIDGAVTAAGANNDLAATIARAGPYGAGNPEPVFAIPGHILAFADEVGTGHIRARLKAPDGAMLNAIAFRVMGKPLGQALLQNRGQAIHVAGTLSVDRWQGAERVQLRLIDAAPVPR